MNAPKRKPRPKPSIRLENALSRDHNGGLVAGVDEAGRGPLAGPVVAAAVIFDLSKPRPKGLADSKLLSAKARESLFGEIQETALAWGIGISHAAEIDQINILEATRVASIRAIALLNPQPVALLTDALKIPACPIPQNPIIKGDQKSVSIAAASILAKVTRDRMMDLYHQEFPEYGWDRNRGYPTAAHLEKLAELGPSSLHRLTFNGVTFFNVEPRLAPSTLRLLDAINRGEMSRMEAASRLGELREQLPPRDVRLIESRLKEP